MPADATAPRDRRKYLLALMYAAGMPIKLIAEKLRYTENTIYELTRSDLFKATVAEIQREMRDATLAGLMDRVEREAIPSFNLLMQLRDGSFDNAQQARIQLDAAKFHLGDMYMDRLMPKVTRQETDDVIRVTFDQDALKQMLGAMHETTGKQPALIDATVTLVDSQPTARPAIPLDQAIADLGE